MHLFFSEYSIITPFLQIIPVESGVIFYGEQQEQAESEQSEQERTKPAESEQKSEQPKQQSGLILKTEKPIYCES